VSRRASLLVTLGLGLAASLAALAALWTRLPARFEGPVVDQMMEWRGARPSDPRVVVCLIDGESIDRYGRWPWPRTRIAELVDALSAAGARVVALDLVFSEPSRYDGIVDLRREDLALAAALERSGEVVLSFFFRDQPAAAAPAAAPAKDPRFRADPENLLPAILRTTGDPEAFPLPEHPGAEPNLNLFAAAAASQGFTTNRREAGVSRRQFLAARFDGWVYPALPLRAVERFTGEGVALAREGALPVIELGERRVEVDERGQLWVDYPGGLEAFHRVSVREVLEGVAGPEELAGKLVFVGASEVGIGDFTAIPFDTELPGVMVHAAVAENLLADRYLREAGLPASCRCWRSSPWGSWSPWRWRRSSATGRARWWRSAWSSLGPSRPSPPTSRAAGTWRW
jgi:adenylate cyclase